MVKTTDMRYPPTPLPPPPVLPEELIVEILLRLPVRSLLRFRCVCKSWKSLTLNPRFVKDHLRTSISDTSMTRQRLVSLIKHDNYKMVTCSVQSLFDNLSVPWETLSFMVEPKYQFIIGSCNGLVCLSNYTSTFRLWNPSTRLASKRSPPIGVSLHYSTTHYGFGYDQVNDKYKVLIVTYDFPNHPKKTKVHTCDTNSWTTIQNPKCEFNRLDKIGKFVSGTLNWLAKKRDAIICFDVEKETFDEVLLPSQMNRGDTLGVLSDCLCVCYSSDADHCAVWLLKKYDIQKTWTKLALISLNSIGYVFFHPFCVSENSIVLGKCIDSKLFLYNSNTNKFDYPKIEGELVNDVLIYHESLVSP